MFQELYMYTTYTIIIILVYILFRIDGDSKGTTLLKTSIEEKETVIDDIPNVLVPAKQLEQGSEEQQKYSLTNLIIFV